MEQILAYRVVSTMGRFLEYKNADPVVGRFSSRNPLRVFQSGNRRGGREKARLRTRLTPETRAAQLERDLCLRQKQKESQASALGP